MLESLHKIVLFSSFFFLSCGPQYVKDPNANVVVTVKYEDGPTRVVRLPGEECKKQYNCGKKQGADCAAELYRASTPLIKEAQELEEKKLYLSATLSYTQALVKLVEAQIRLSRSKTENYQDWKVAVTFGLDEKIKKKIKLCEKKIFLLKCKR